MQGWVELISEYGVMIIISAIFLYTAIKFINLGFDYFKKSLGNKKHDKLLEIRQEVDETVFELLQEFMQSHNGNRVRLIEFTNSVTSVAHLPFKYMSCTYEVFDYGEQSTARHIDKLSTSLFTPFLTELNKKNYIILDENDCKCCGTIHDLMQTMEINKSMCTMLKVSKNKAIGYLAFNKQDGFSDEDISDIQVLASKLSGLLGILDN